MQWTERRLLCSGRNKTQNLVECFLKMGHLIAFPCTVNLANKNGFGWPNVEIGQKVANQKLLFLALLCKQ